MALKIHEKFRLGLLSPTAGMYYITKDNPFLLATGSDRFGRNFFLFLYTAADILGGVLFAKGEEV